MTTFGDLMALLMCFFVLLLSFSEIDAQKYKEVAGSLSLSFGVQLQQKEATASPAGTSFVAREFNPGRVEPNQEQVVMQELAALRAHLDIVRQSRHEVVAQKAERLRQQLQEDY